ncbi:MAG: GIY-YIG nuclease family protein [Christensenellaceae bacterium]|jgi:hypothetical protein|nr:GIY-YIG nuclease family protein [Christensenellaceae bacterium]
MPVSEGSAERLRISKYLDDVTTGCVTSATLDGSTWMVYRIPRAKLSECKDWDAFKKSGVYILFGSDAENNGFVYIGDAKMRGRGDAVYNRLSENSRGNTDVSRWSEAIVFVGDSFDQTEISYIKSYFCKLANDAGRYVVNCAAPQEDQKDFWEFLDNAKFIMGPLGCDVFEPLETPKPKKMFYIKKPGIADAKGYINTDGKSFVLLAGSVIRENILESAATFVRELRDKHSKKGNIVGCAVLQKDITLDSPSKAAGFVLAASANALDEWKTENGEKLIKLDSGLYE